MFDTDMLPSTRALFAAALILFFLSAAVAVTRPVSADMVQYPVEADVTDELQDLEMGVSVDADKIDFGQIPARMISAEKSVTVTNNEARRVQLHVHAQGNISDYLTFSPETFTLSRGETQEITLTFETTNRTVPGHYTGTVTVEEQTAFWRVLWATH